MFIIGICDDEQICRELLCGYCKNVEMDLNQSFDYKLFSDGEEVLAYDDKIDILLLDIGMNGENGIDIMKKIENNDNIKNILFVSGYSQYVYDSFGLKTRGFICKPVEYDRFKNEIKKIIEAKKDDNRLLEIVEQSEKKYMSSDDIILIEANGKALKIYTAQGLHHIRGSLNDWLLKLEGYNVIQVHRSYIVNLGYVSNIKDVVTFRDMDIEVPLGRKYRDTSRESYRKYIFNTYKERTNVR